MAHSDLFVGAYWGPRKESMDQCVHRFMSCLEELHNCDAVFASWYQGGVTGRDAHKHVILPTSLDQITKLFEAGKQRGDFESAVGIEELGFQVGVWNGGTEDKALSFSADVVSIPITPISAMLSLSVCRRTSVCFPM